ncbi:hypothetical protein ZIOFF_059318 [Zingiber officinale]|uniref:Elongation factor Ts, mitochondrial n=1 Tax=Zingiber officinale TaxID=94328 RepID=A0A8J5F7B0_ZINOF|nr:hypothetical protein ZIOFF_059318 [Zingiber officinale]
MAFSTSAKKSIWLVVSKLNPLGQPSRGYFSPISPRQFANQIVWNQVFMRKFSAEVSATDQINRIKQLRERTSAPIKDVKSSLVNCNWDLEAAQKDLRKRGVVLASKKSSRTASEGLLSLAQMDKKAVVVELNCETDFVARNDTFQYLVSIDLPMASALARAALSIENPTPLSQEAFAFGPEYLENMKINLDHPKLSGETTVQTAVTEVAAMVGENVKIRRGYALSSTSYGAVVSYLHTCPQPGLGRIAGLVTLEVEDGNASLDALQRVGSSLAMHIVASKPLFLSKELVPSEALESERDILKTQVLRPIYYSFVQGSLVLASFDATVLLSLHLIVVEHDVHTCELLILTNFFACIIYVSLLFFFFLFQAESSGKSQIVVEKMVEGRIRKYYEEVVLSEQKYFLDDSISVKVYQASFIACFCLEALKSLLNDLSKELGSSVRIGKFLRMEVGEGIQRAGA